MKILVVEDELELLKSIEEGLSISGYVVDTSYDGLDAEEMTYINSYDLIILDINIPSMDGFSLLKKIRERDNNVNIIILTAIDEVEYRVMGLDLGANDYMVKPFYFAELEARIRSLLRRKTVQENVNITAGCMEFYTNTRELYVNGNLVKLTKKETKILEYMMLNKDRVISQEELLEHVWNDDINCFSNTVRVHMSSLRKKLKKESGRDLIKNIIGEGYIIC